MNQEDIKNVVKEILDTISNELKDSSSTMYVCDDSTTFINTDVGYVEDWFKEYKKYLYKKYDISEEEE